MPIYSFLWSAYCDHSLLIGITVWSAMCFSLWSLSAKSAEFKSFQNYWTTSSIYIEKLFQILFFKYGWDRLLLTFEKWSQKLIIIWKVRSLNLKNMINTTVLLQQSSYFLGKMLGIFSYKFIILIHLKINTYNFYEYCDRDIAVSLWSINFISMWLNIANIGEKIITLKG